MSKRNRKAAPKGLSGDMRPLVLSLIRDLYDDLPDPDRLVSLTAREDASCKVLRGVIAQLVSDAESSMHSLTIREYAALRQLEAFFKKNVTGAARSSERKARALEKFSEAEAKCRRSNKRLLHFKDRPSRMSPMVQELLASARLDIFRLLGPFDGDDLQACLESCDFGPGSTFGSTDRDHTHLYYKVGAEPITVTPEAVRYLPMLVDVFPHWAQALVESDARYQVVPGNRITTVPKTADIDRVIAIEPSFNVFLQKGADKVMGGLLKKWGVTIHDQSRNYLPARIGSVNGYFSTIDLSSASDCVSLELVRYLYPPGWFDFLNSLRSHRFTYDKGKTWHVSEKFSSMGNATTFPCESLIFASLLRAACRITGTPLTGARCYGDDIIAPRNVSLLLIEALGFCGFSVNRAKTFVFGPFRESCGVDYFHGVDVRPVYLKQYPRTENDAYNAFNRLRVNRFGFRFDHTLKYLWDLVPNRCVAPSNSGAQLEFRRWYNGSQTSVEAGFHVPASVVCHYRKHIHHLQVLGWRVPTRGQRFRAATGLREEFRYLCFLLGVEGGEVELPSSLVSFRRFQTFTVWNEYGAWPAWMTAVSLRPLKAKNSKGGRG